MSDVLTIGVFLQELNIPTLKRQADALELLQREIDKLFKSKIEPDLAKIARGYGREKFIQKVVADGLEYYYNEFKKYIQEDYSTEFKKLLQEESWLEIQIKDIHIKSDKEILITYTEALDYCFKIYTKHYIFLNNVMKTFSFIGNQTEKLAIFFQHKLFLYSQVRFDEVSLRYFYLEYYLYEEFVKNSRNESSFKIPSSDVEMRKETTKKKIPLMKAVSGEYFDCDQTTRAVPMSKFGHIQKVSEISDRLIYMGWMNFVEESCDKILYQLIDKKIIKYENTTNRPVLAKINNWFQTIVIKWLERILQPENKSNSGADFSAAAHIQERNSGTIVEQWKSKLEFYLNDKFARMRYSKLFDLKTMNKYEYCLEDLKQILDKTDILQEFSYKLKEEFESSLLIPGIQTTTIIQQYIKAIRILRILDPSAVCLEIVSEPIKEYLRSRQDTLKRIVDIVINQENSEIYKELGHQYTQIPLKFFEEEKKQPKVFQAPNMKKKENEDKNEMSFINENKDDFYYISSDEDEEAARKWKPAPINAKINRHISTKFIKSDIISTLVNIYGSQDQFLEEYRNMLSERLLNSKEYDLILERENIELLKSRFGDSSVLYCDVMLKDIKDSERSLNDFKNKSNVNESTFTEDNLLELKDVDAVIISKEYWNVTVDDAQFKFPYTVSEPFEMFSKYYSEKSKLSEINYLSNLGNVELTLTFANGSFKFNVSPIHAAIISLFNDTEDNLSDEFLAEKLSITTTQLKEKISFWVMKGVLVEEQKKSRIKEYMNKSSASGGDKSCLVTSYKTPKELNNGLI